MLPKIMDIKSHIQVGKYAVVTRSPVTGHDQIQSDLLPNFIPTDDSPNVAGGC